MDVAIVGAGVVGSATALELCRRGRTVILLDRFATGHRRGSSHGPTRIFRLSYPDPRYSELAVEALDDWARLERDGSRKLIDFTGGLDLGEGALACAAALEGLGLEFDQLDHHQATDLTGLRLDPDIPVIFQPQTGVISAEGTVALQVELARKAGCQIKTDTRVFSLSGSAGGGAMIETDKGELRAGVAVISAGAWTGPVAATAGFDLPLVVTAEQVTYFRPQRDDLLVIIDWADPLHYVVPAAFGSPGWKVGVHQTGEEVDPELGPFPAAPEKNDRAAKWLGRLTGVLPEVLSDEVCLYTRAPSDEFILDRSGDVVVVSACSGHGFKFAPRIGRAAADLADGLDPGLPGGIGQT